MIDYSEAFWKIDKYMPEQNPELMDEWEELEKEKNANNILEFLELHANEERMYSYFPKGGTLKEFSEFIAKRKT